MRQKYQAMVLVVVMLFSLLIPYGTIASAESSNSFQDLKGHWAEKEIQELITNNIVTGSSENGNLVINPNLEITRAEFFTILIRSLNIKIENEAGTNLSSFSDIQQHWAKSYIETAKNYQITNGYEDGTFKPNQYITRAEAVTAIVRAYQLEGTDTSKLTFTDITNKHWAYSNILIAIEKQLVNGYSNETFRPENNITRAESFVLVYRVLHLEQDNEEEQEKPEPTPIASETPVVGGGSVPPVVTPTPTPEPETPEVLAILVDQVTGDEAYTTNEEQANLTGKFQIDEQIEAVSASYQSITSEELTTIEIDIKSDKTWSINDISLEIGSNNVSVHVKTALKEYDRQVVINRVNQVIEYADTVTTFNIEDEEDLQIIEDISSSIVSYTIDDMGTPYDPADDVTVLLVLEDSPLVKSLKNDDLSVGDIVSIPPTEQFLAGWTFMIQEYGEPTDFINYPSHLYEEITVITPGLADIFQGDISLDFSGKIDADDPIAFSFFPEGVEVVPFADSNLIEEQAPEIPIALRFSTFAAASNKPGFQWGQLKNLLIPTVNATSGDKLDILINFGGSGGVVLYDHDGDLTGTKNDQVKISGQTGIKNLSTTAGIEWHPNYNPFNLDLLPQQIIFKTTYDKVNQIKAEFSAGLSLENVVNDANKALNGSFENKNQFIGMDITGIDFKDQIALGALGIRLDIPPTYATLGGHQVTSKIVGFSPILLIIPVIDVTGKLEAKLSVTYAYNSYVETGVNIQKVGFTGAYGPIEANRGQKTIDLPFDRQLEIYDIEGKSKSNKHEKPIPTLTVEGAGTAEASFGVGVMAGLMLNGVIPAAVKGSAYARAKATLNGTAKWEDSFVPKITGSGQLGIDVGVRLGVNAKLQAKTPFGSPGFAYKHDWEYRFIDYNLVSVAVTGDVKEADYDNDITNNPTLSGVKVEAQKVYAFDIPGNEPLLSTTTDADGKFVLSGATSGKYKVTFSKAGYIRYSEIVTVGTSNASMSVILDKQIDKVLAGKVLAADNDTDMSNNEALEDVKVTAKKLLSSSNKIVSVLSDANGDYIISGLSPGLYEVTAKKSNYVTVTQLISMRDDGQLTRNLSIEMVAVSAADLIGIASGQVINALTGEGISDITLNIRTGINTNVGEIIATTTTGSNGAYTIELPAGNYSVEAVGTEGLHTAVYHIKVEGNTEISNQNGVMTPIIPEGQLRIILRWGETPRDLDSHLVGPAANNPDDRFHIYFSNKSYYADGIKFADLDVDDISSWGPETVTIYQQSPGKYRYFVHDYTNRNSNSSLALAQSGAFVEVYTSASASPLATYYVPYEEGNAWAVFEYDSETNTITAINQMMYGTSSFDMFQINSIQNKSELDEDVELITSSFTEDK